MTLERSQRALARARAKAHKTVDDFPLVTIVDVSNRLELRRVTGLLGAETVFVDVTGVTEAMSDDDLIRVWPQPDKAGIYKFHSFVRRSGTNTAGDVFVPDLRTNTITGPHGFTVEVFDAIGHPGEGHQSRLEWSQAGGVWRIHAANDGTAAGLDIQKGNISLAAGYTVDGVDVSVLDNDAIKKTLMDAKGDLIVASADNAVTRLGVGSDGAFLIPDSGQATGLKWTTTLKETATALVVNDGQTVDKDFVVKGKTDAQLIVADYDEDAVAIGGAVVSGVKLSVYGDTAITGHLVVGGVRAAPLSNYTFEAREITTVTSGVWNAMVGIPESNPASASSANLRGFYGGPKIASGCAQDHTGSLTGAQLQPIHDGTGTLAMMYGASVVPQNTSTGIITEARGINIGFTNSGGGGIGTCKAIRWAAVTYGGINYALYGEGGQSLLMAGTPTVTPLVLRGAASQTADLAQLQTSAAAVRRAWDANGLDKLMADQVTDTAPNDDATLKKLTLQRRAAAPSNAAYIAFQQCPGTDVFYLVLEEG
jgi:hypothetical protein